MYFNHMDCCGVKEISGIRYDYRHPRPLKMLRDIWAMAERAKWGFAFLVFTDHNSTRNGQKFAEFLRKHDLGEIVETKKKRNSNSGNMVRVWVWGVNKRKMKAFAKTEGWYDELTRQEKEWEEKKAALGRTAYAWNAPHLVRIIHGLD